MQRSSSRCTALISCSVPFFFFFFFFFFTLFLLTRLIYHDYCRRPPCQPEFRHAPKSLSGLGDLKIVERPSVYTIAPHGFQTIKATIKVSSTETGVIFGSILWEGPHLSEQCVILNDIHIDIMDYIKPTYCSEAQVSQRFCFFLFDQWTVS